jgi:acetylornithine deacetylase/succinyl-diaminopimelate desuccinylase-like protein
MSVDALLAMAARREAIIADADALMRVDSSNPPGNCAPVAAVAEQMLRQVPGARVFRADFDAANANVVAVLENGAGSGVMLNGHLDTYGIGDEAAWTVPPLAATVRGEFLNGRGASDMKGGIAAMLSAFRALAAHRDLWRGRVVLALASDEESMGTRGTRHLLETVPECRADACLIADAGSPRVARFGEKGMLWLRLSAIGRAAHGAHVHLGDNAAARLIEAVRRIQALAGMPFRSDPAIAAAVHAAAPVSEAEAGEGETATLLNVTVNLGTISGGRLRNLVADRAEAELDIRIPFGLSAQAVEAAVRAALASLPGIRIKVQVAWEPTATPPASPIVRCVLDAGKAILGTRPVATMRVGASDARLTRAAGIPTVVYGPAPINMGAPDEHVAIADLVAVAKVHALATARFLGGG